MFQTNDTRKKETTKKAYWLQGPRGEGKGEDKGKEESVKSNFFTSSAPLVVYVCTQDTHERSQKLNLFWGAVAYRGGA